ncbi:MAG TPA: hypothetical protein VLT33_42335, partial [Labilithrix sp.]|nr:hypothetical protein [Labilithrix sp.]
MSNASELPKGGVRQGGKEELRATLLKTYLLRIRSEKGERAVRTILTNAGIDPAMVDNETGWVSSLAAKRALRGICELLGMDALRQRGEWVTNAEALGAMVRMLRSAEYPIDAYEYLAANAREVTRIGTWEIAVVAAKDGDKEPPSTVDVDADAPPEPKEKKKVDKSRVRAVRLVYRPRTDGYDEPEKPDSATEVLFCAAREGELAGMPRIWGLP